MSKIQRYQGDVRAFASAQQSGERYIFGDTTTESDSLSDQLTTDYLRGWAVISASDEPPLEWFNAVAFTATQFISYLHQSGIPEWNGEQEYHDGSQANFNGQIYTCLTDDHTSVTTPNTDPTNWKKASAGDADNADKLDGQHGSFYRDASNLNAGTVSNERLPSSISSDITGNAATADNAGDSDKLDGQHGNYYLSRSNHTGTQSLSTISDAGTAAATNTVDIVAETVKNQTGGKWVVHESANGVPCVFYRMPAFSYDDLQIDNCPFTGVMDLFRNSDGSIRPYHDFAVYMAGEKNGDLVSVGGGVPVSDISYDKFLQQASDSGFQMFSVYERACLNWLMIANNFQPRGNTEFGRSHEIFREFGQRQDDRVPNDRDGKGKTLTGTGPNSWNHDGTSHGITDLVGNQWEWCDDFKMVDGEFVVAEYCGQPESEWSKTGRFIAPGHKFAMANRGDASSDQVWSEFTKEGGYEGHELLQRLLIEPIDITRVLTGRFYYDTTSERLPFVGGSWGGGILSGPAALRLSSQRSYRGASLGGRLAKRSNS